MFDWVDPETTDAKRCTNAKKPIEVRTCSLPTCEATVYWVAGSWSKVFLVSDDIYLTE